MSLLERRHPTAIDLGLERCGAVYDALGAPRPGKSVVTVGGTNGKGSTVAWLAAVLGAAGRSVATYTSPHLLRFNERLRLPEGEVGDAALVRAFEAVEAARNGESLTYFEFTTLACLWLMARRRPDVAVLEVGLGGRLDTVNLVDANIAVITVVGLDHQDYLGDDRESIGAEKAGILRPTRPLVCGETRPPASVLETAAKLGCPTWLPERDYRLVPFGSGWRFLIGERTLALDGLKLAGRHQADNLGAALAAACLLEPDLEAHGASVARAAACVSIPGRLQTPAHAPRFCLDVGHNPMAARAVARVLRSRGGRWACVLGMLGDKDVAGVVEELGDVISAWYCAGLAGVRGQSAEALAARVAPGAGSTPVRAFAEVPSACRAALRLEAADSGILVFGSFRTVAEAGPFLHRLHEDSG